jgi:hypothetical protein
MLQRILDRRHGRCSEPKNIKDVLPNSPCCTTIVKGSVAADLTWATFDPYIINATS